MAQIDELRETRLRKLKALKSAGILAYPATPKRTHRISDALKNFPVLSKQKKEIILAGRIRTVREHGGSTFFDFEDGSEISPQAGGKMQAFLKKNGVGEKQYQFFFDFFDIGDFIEIRGFLFKTKKEEKTIEVADFKMLAKSIRSLPEKWHGLQDIEERLRKRYLDILFNPAIKEMIRKRAIFWAAMREFLLERGFLEVETPVLEVTAGGADARPFKTRHNALDMDVYLRISMGELWQKRLMVAGFEKIFELGRQFRNEGMDAEHLQDYTQMEFYWAYADHDQGMDLVEEMYKYVAKKTFGTLKFRIKNFDIDLAKKWERYDYCSTIQKYTKIDVQEASLQEMEAALNKLGVEYDRKGFNKTRAMDNLWKYCRKNLSGPGFLINLPIDVSPLAKRNEKSPKTVLRFQVILAGSELGNGYSELNNPVEQAERFSEQQKLREKGDKEAQMFDRDFVEALEYGMPPTCGFGVSERLFSFLMDKPARECQIFPLMKPKEK